MDNWQTSPENAPLGAQHDGQDAENAQIGSLDGLGQKPAEKGTNAWLTTQQPFVIAIANQKGGVAKTTTVASLGGALVQLEQEVLVIDLDSQANLTIALGKDPGRVRGSVTDVFFNSASLLSVSRETNIPGLDLVPANSGMDLAERFLPSRKNYEHILKSAMEEILLSRPIYHFILLDCPPYMGAVTLNALAAADLLIIPTQPEYFSAYALRSMMTTIQKIRGQYNPDLVYRILVTMVDRRNRIHNQVDQQIRATFGEGVFNTEIRTDTKLRESAVVGTPITHLHQRSRSAVEYTDLAQELLVYVRSLSSKE